MSFRELYDYIQTQPIKISRSTIIPAAKESSGKNSLRFIKTSFDEEICRGIFLSGEDLEKKFPNIKEENLIIINRNLNYCWERFVTVKEVMHLFDSNESKTASVENLDRLLLDLAEYRPATSNGTRAEFLSFWRALSCFCPEKNRLEYESMLQEGRIDYYGIAIQLKIPEKYVPRLFSPNYRRALEID